MRTLFSTCGQISEFIYSVILSTYYEEDTVLATGDSIVSKPSQSLPWESCVLWRDIKQLHIQVFSCIWGVLSRRANAQSEEVVKEGFPGEVILELSSTCWLGITGKGSWWGRAFMIAGTACVRAQGRSLQHPWGTKAFWGERREGAGMSLAGWALDTSTVKAKERFGWEGIKHYSSVASIILPVMWRGTAVRWE